MDKEAIKLDIRSILDVSVDAICNEVNEDLIFSEDAYSTLKQNVPEETVLECLKIGQIRLGTAAVTSAGNLKTNYIIHLATCGFDGQSSEPTIIEALRDGLNKAKELNVHTIAIPEVGRFTSIMPLKRLAELLLSECLRQNDRDLSLETVYFCLSDQKSYDIFDECLRQI